MSSGGRRYSPEFRAEAVALASTVGSVRAAKVLGGVSYRSIARWLREPASSPIIAAAEATVAERLVAAHERALTALERDLDNPNARLSDRARALEVLGSQAQLATGRASVHIAVAGAGQSDPTSHLPPELVELLHAAYDAIFVLFLDKYGRGTQRVICDGERVWTEGEAEGPWRLHGPNGTMTRALPERTDVRPEPPRMPPEALERPRTNETPSPVVRIPEPPPRRLIVNARNEVI
jgi:transposase-like protein